MPATDTSSDIDKQKNQHAPQLHTFGLLHEITPLLLRRRLTNTWPLLVIEITEVEGGLQLIFCGKIVW